MASKTEILKKSKQREKKIDTARQIFGVILIFLIIVGLWLLFNCQFFRLNKFLVTGTTFENKSNIGQKAKEATLGSYYFFVPKDSVFFYQKDFILNFLRKSFPRLDSIEITSPELNSLKIVVTDKKPKLIWCEGENFSAKCFYLDDSGQTYSEAPNFSENIFFKLAGYDLGGKVGLKVLTPEKLKRVATTLSFLAGILPELEKGGSSLKILQTKVLPADDFAVEIGANSSSTTKFQILFNANRETEDLVNNLSSVLKNESFLAEIKNKQQRLDYLDLRFGRKIFYKFL
ncbi:MAG: hypothetical protein NTV48_00460 [Candidatus Vogelbacteria bacterium]|nr:hypothetical protein [Candidatus Vogelbacteria bacterium]